MNRTLQSRVAKLELGVVVPAHINVFLPGGHSAGAEAKAVAFEAELRKLGCARLSDAQRAALSIAYLDPEDLHIC